MGQVLALEDSVFLEYAKTLGIDKEAIAGSIYPIIISDYIPIKKGDGSKPAYQKVLNISEPTAMKTTYGKYGDMIIGGQMVTVGSVEQAELDVLSSTQQVPGIPKRPTEIASQINGYAQYHTRNITLYIPNSKFSNLIKDKRFSTIYEVVPGDEKEEGLTDEILKERLTDKMKEYKLMPYSESLCRFQEKRK